MTRRYDIEQLTEREIKLVKELMAVHVESIAREIAISRGLQGDKEKRKQVRQLVQEQINAITRIG